MNTHRDENWFSANARTAPYLWVFVGFSLTPAILWWQSAPILIGSYLAFIASYVWLYASIVKFKTPKWLHFEQ